MPESEIGGKLEYFSARVPAEFKSMLRELSVVLSRDLGARISQTQAMQMAVAEVLNSRKTKEEE